MELVDKFDKRREPLNKKTERYEKINGEYCQYVHTWIMNDKNEFLIQKRSANKKIYPNKWSQTGGAVDSGETSLQGAIREVKEELGIEIDKEKIEFILSFKRKYGFIDVWLVKQNVDLKDITLQEEVSEVRWVTKEKLEKMIENDKVAGTINMYFKMFMDILENFSL